MRALLAQRPRIVGVLFPFPLRIDGTDIAERSMTDILEEVQRAAEQIYPLVRETPLDFSRCFSDKTGSTVFLKLENLQHTGSFKLRGAANKLRCLSGAERRSGSAGRQISG